MKGSRGFNYILVIFLLVLLFCIYLGNKFTQSLFFNSTDRIQVLFYGQNTRLYSLGNSDGVHYVVPFNPDIKMKIPGGYGTYRIGALLKLIDLQKDQDILTRTFSVGTAAYVRYVFFSKESPIYYGSQYTKGDEALPSFKSFFWSRSNSSFFDILYLWLHFAGKKPSDFTEIDIKTKVLDNDKVFLDDVFSKTYIGYFYQRKLRDEHKSVQILYQNKYYPAQLISRLIEGNGIRVSDISQINIQQKCVIIESGNSTYSLTAKSLSQFFKCPLKKDKTEISDIIIYLGDKEGKWEVEK